MAVRPKGYGMTAELQEKKDANYNPQLEAEARGWLQALVKEPFPSGSFGEALKNGIYLCKAINVLSPGSVRKINQGSLAFKQMENISFFLEAIGRYGVNKADSFQTVDLFEEQNLNQVVSTIHALGRQAQAKRFGGPTLGAKVAVKQDYNFDPEQQKQASASVIGLQMGSNRGASQAGMTPYGLQRQLEKTNLKN